jgi:HAD superfamily hydrolase (TIGR01509 family)
VLVDSEVIVAAAIAEALGRAGMTISANDVLTRYTGRTAASARPLLEAELGRPLPEDVFAGLRERTGAVFARELRAVAGVAEALDRLLTPACVASGGSHEKMRYTLGLTGLFERFAGRIFSASEVARGKPAPDLFLHAARTLGADPARCAVVEDTAVGVEAARAAGMLVFGYAERMPASLLAGARTFTEMSALPELLREAGAAVR